MRASTLKLFITGRTSDNSCLFMRKQTMLPPKIKPQLDMIFDPWLMWLDTYAHNALVYISFWHEDLQTLNSLTTCSSVINILMNKTSLKLNAGKVEILQRLCVIYNVKTLRFILGCYLSFQHRVMPPIKQNNASSIPTYSKQPSRQQFSVKSCDKSLSLHCLFITKHQIDAIRV